MFERPNEGKSACVISINFGDTDFEESVEEIKELVLSADMNIVSTVNIKRAAPDPKYFLGSGKAEEVKFIIQESKADTVIFNHNLSPSQERNLEKYFSTRIFDRTALILLIFAKRAKSHEGKLQVELAQLDHLSTRLIKGWSHLERQKGGIGVRGGPGEKQLELDRRMLKLRIKQLKEKLDKLKRQRTMQRKKRSRSNVLNISIVGYTNAGKSTLFNQLTHANALAMNQLFATLDTTSRKLFIQEGVECVISDTVGFIKALPTTLIEAFKSTLEESREADLLLHVVNMANPNHSEQIAAVNKILEEIKAASIPQILVLNQIDRLDIKANHEKDEYGRISTIQLSAKTGEGIELLKEAILQLHVVKQSSETEIFEENPLNY
ncbi:GTPase HflX [Candidatus Methylopumilus universalis]|uniref:GTPase HflX n=1 Tax=Candidatus Methylopumilus universalis TaxID=2588536 RepID=A0AAX1EZL5_9PROT|nr:GTPase HflX [Candidatus Methylopumilus universalis]QDC41209.1 GTPase HflX [Candidatus Methylopumilus universalis]QDC42499.1 GTPase HflX [Candidatus Methylopumilus universalis]QDC54885.1 GTPase HflX [Candidatus Methylopumilus universalis]QDC56166.1 GTPase HflX [Candidatus Methylopumilus universalis]QDC57448.1 GTPase HflX [Candidatus Methylopumilus universalis]